MPRGLAAAALAADSIGFEAGGPLDVVLRRPGSRGCTGLSLGDLDSCSSPDVLPFRWQAPTRHTSFVVAAAAAAGVISKTSAGRAELIDSLVAPLAVAHIGASRSLCAEIVRADHAFICMKFCSSAQSTLATPWCDLPRISDIERLLS
eukprot:TRINITY_DN20006_c0_g1_i2.p1 TRINITY_DN20006_c0_g1~~TRINITY_DN20006_c0_g1_i2.p1  ORF type:complete len:148 (-),score=19.11 TRINITY_DN20006_c0_g1_i2:45-488(-)